MKVIIIGGVAGGATAAARLRRLDESAEIIILERTGYVSYANCGLPYFLSGVIADEGKLTLQTPASFKERFNIDVRVRNEAVAIDPDAKTVTVRRLEDGSEYTEDYDALVYAPGARATRPDMPGADDERILTMRTVEDTFRIRQLIEARNPRTAIVVGGGFIGLEVAENLVEAGIAVTLLQRSDQVLRPLDRDMASLIHNKLRAAGVDLRLGTPVVGYERPGEGEGMRVITEEGGVLEADLVFIGLGTTPDTVLAKEAGIELGRKGAVVVDDHMRTSAPDIYAVGDAVEIVNSVSGQKALIPLAGPANKQGRIAANNICGIDDVYTGSLGSSIVKVFDLTAAATGLNSSGAKAAGIDFDSVVLRPASHATYYPGSSSITMKVLFEPATGRIIGAQALGKEEVAKQVDVFATAITAGMTAADLEDLDLAYAPPFSSAKSPVNMAGFIIENLRAGRVKQFHWDDVAGLPRDGSITLLDTRTEGEYARGHYDGTVNIPLDSLRGRLDELDASKPVYVNCQVGLRGYIACRILMAHGFDCYNLTGGYGFYREVLEGLS
ncbi:MAG: FAD-dependent oxidoreductase [Coriobacteriales bacterium]|nr:FAD-dependent oxidoreductase [Coriobacteriales bacterium]